MQKKLIEIHTGAAVKMAGGVYAKKIDRNTHQKARFCVWRKSESDDKQKSGNSSALKCIYEQKNAGYTIEATGVCMEERKMCMYTSEKMEPARGL